VAWLGLSPVSIALVLLACASIAYLLLAIRAVARFREAGPATGTFLPPITLLKPLCGDEDRLYECLRSFCDEDYPTYQVVFGVRDANDPAVAVVRRLQAEYSQRDLVLVCDPAIHGPNLKVSNLINMMAACRHDIVVISDSDVEIAPTTLATVVGALADPKVGAVTCLYKGAPIGGAASDLGALYINDWFLPSALVDYGMNGMSSCFGPLTVVRRTALEAAGGLEALSDYLADDHRLGRLISQNGYDVVLSDCTVNTMVNEEALEDLIAHEARWGRTVRACRAMDHVLSVVTFALAPLLVLLSLSPSWVGFGCVATHLLLRVVLHQMVKARFSLASPGRLWLLPLREILCFVVWAMSLMGHRISWRDHHYSVAEDGRLVAEGSSAHLAERPVIISDDRPKAA
jgi:ceramide glucosyltransferase